MAGRIDARLRELGLELPTPGAPAANYVPWVQTGHLLFISGQLSQTDPARRVIGKLGAGLTIEQGRQAARLCALQLIAQLRAALGGDLDRMERVVRVGGFVHSAPDFHDQPQVMNGCSDVLVEVFGEAGRHARTAVGVIALPFGVAVEADAIFAVRE
ncbi:MAG TPA: RidA family protein [Candidatus Polarisedimenticolaceae bacterium]|nr:RidA family protein [Candidatus Polarisedimenticolaceae bacterium]